MIEYPGKGSTLTLNYLGSFWECLEISIPKLLAGQDAWKFLIQPPSICLIKSLRSLRNEISQDPW